MNTQQIISCIKNKHWSDLLIDYPTIQRYAINKDLSTFWQECPNGEWLLRFVHIDGNSDHKLVVKAACQIARLVLPLVKQGENRPRVAIETTEKWLVGEATLEEVKAAADAADAA